MKLPICKEDAEKRELCDSCQEKFEEGEITQTDIELSRILHKLNQKETIADEVDLIKTVELNDTVLALVEGNPAVLIGKGGRIIRMISDELGEKVRVMKNGSVIQMANDLTTPVRTCGVNILYKENGEIEKSITIPEENKKRIKIDPEKVEKAIGRIKDEEYNVKFI